MQLHRTPLLAGAMAMLLLAFATASHARDEAMTAEEFIDDASALNTGELNAADIALDKEDASQEVRDFAQTLRNDHRQVQEKLKELAQQRNDADLSMLSDAESMAAAAKLMVMGGDAFDADFAEAQVNAHRKFISFMEEAEKRLEDEELKRFASEQLPTLRKHLKTAEQLQEAHPQQ